MLLGFELVVRGCPSVGVVLLYEGVHAVSPSFPTFCFEDGWHCVRLSVLGMWGLRCEPLVIYDGAHLF